VQRLLLRNHYTVDSARYSRNWCIIKFINFLSNAQPPACKADDLPLIYEPVIFFDGSILRHQKALAKYSQRNLRKFRIFQCESNWLKFRWFLNESLTKNDFLVKLLDNENMSCRRRFWYKLRFKIYEQTCMLLFLSLILMNFLRKKLL